MQDASQLRNIAERLFTKHPVALREKGQDFPIRIHSFQEGMLVASHNRPQAQLRILLLKQNDQTLYLECAVVQKKLDMEHLKPLRLHLYRSIRGAKRVEAGNKDTAQVSNFFPIIAIAEKMADRNDLRDSLVKIYRDKIAAQFPSIQIHIRRSSRMSSIVQYLQKSKKSVFMPDLNDPGILKKIAEDHKNRFASPEEYGDLRRIGSDAVELRSEVYVPLSYRHEYVYGYFQVQSETPLDLNQFVVLERAAHHLQNEFEKRRFLPASEEMCPVVDLTLSGIGFVQSLGSPYLKTVASGDEVILDLHLPGGTTGLRGYLRNIRTVESNHRIGVEFVPESVLKSMKLAQYLSKNEPA